MSNEVDAYWSKCYETGRDFRMISSRAISTLLRFANTAQGGRCLDVGCGTGQLTRELYHRGFNVVGIDVSESAIDIARKLTTVSRRRLQYLHLDIECGGLSKLVNQSYDLITCKFVYALIKDKPAFLLKVHQLLAPNGAFVVITPVPEDVPAEKKMIIVASDDMSRLAREFDQTALYQEHGLICFVGRRRRVLTEAA
ncbi:2-polyprenyl-3-methyl-5-hydroxy-6-metoxy-1,4-benzoquinol methylase [Kibdelosporangium banguiense]|uniref:2-polyprenyl-3-methyl-5-hydroxy-6-metoxy-1, 4-benzoquinol methylase n=1 Tax=Kibdelosporangium banguiense TaxID=1365924 RepID=A0ABS4TDZ6_9PSEU|nr:class I SAM-dependent methyltransferase [Kibdelosporangium banguiense]MBP2322634.1 2-polyprenyl-3-methyl-5-hydroxy-6-metoxy-1,4-benzoquinol methylase [Kibdelosporangium banguiense]